MLGALEKFLMLAGKKAGEYGRTPLAELLTKLPADALTGGFQAGKAGVSAVRRDPAAAMTGAVGAGGLAALLGGDEEEPADEELAELLKAKGYYA